MNSEFACLFSTDLHSFLFLFRQGAFISFQGRNWASTPPSLSFPAWVIGAVSWPPWSHFCTPTVLYPGQPEMFCNINETVSPLLTVTSLCVKWNPNFKIFCPLTPNNLCSPCSYPHPAIDCILTMQTFRLLLENLLPCSCPRAFELVSTACRALSPGQDSFSLSSQAIGETTLDHTDLIPPPTCHPLALNFDLFPLRPQSLSDTTFLFASCILSASPPPPPPKHKCSETRDFVILFLEYCLCQRRCSGNMCWVTGRKNGRK